MFSLTLPLYVIVMETGVGGAYLWEHALAKLPESTVNPIHGGVYMPDPADLDCHLEEFNLLETAQVVIITNWDRRDLHGSTLITSLHAVHPELAFIVLTTMTKAASDFLSANPKIIGTAQNKRIDSLSALMADGIDQLIDEQSPRLKAVETAG